MGTLSLCVCVSPKLLCVFFLILNWKFEWGVKSPFNKPWASQRPLVALDTRSTIYGCCASARYKYIKSHHALTATKQAQFHRKAFLWGTWLLLSSDELWARGWMGKYMQRAQIRYYFWNARKWSSSFRRAGKNGRWWRRHEIKVTKKQTPLEGRSNFLKQHLLHTPNSGRQLACKNWSATCSLPLVKRVSLWASERWLKS